VPRISAWCEEEGKYWIIGREVGDSGTPHLQGYVSLRKRRTFIYVRNKLSNRCHVESSRGTARQNREYCSKGGNFIEEVLSMKEESARIEMRQQDRSWLPSDEEIKAWLNSPVKSPTHGSIMDLTCSETPYPSLPPLNVNQFTSGGSMELPEWASLV